MGRWGGSGTASGGVRRPHSDDTGLSQLSNSKQGPLYGTDEGDMHTHTHARTQTGPPMNIELGWNRSACLEVFTARIITCSLDKRHLMYPEKSTDDLEGV